MPDFGFDDWIDAQLRHVPLPPDLLSRLAADSAAQEPPQAEARLDAVLRNVPVPKDLESRLLRIARRRRPNPVWRQVGLAASLFVMLGLGASAYVALVVDTAAPDASVIASTTAPPAAVESPRLAQSPAATVPEEQVVVARSTVTEQPDRHEQLVRNESDKLPFTIQDVAAMGASVRQAFEAKMRSQATLGAGGAFDSLPPLDAFEAPPSRGIAPPRVRGYDLLFLLKHGEHPFVSPAGDKQLRESKLPFTFRTASFDRAVADAEAGRLPNAEEIRVEDFLAAQEYALPSAVGRGLALHVAVGPSPFGEQGLYLLQPLVQAGANRAQPHPPARLIVAVEASSPMHSAGRWQTIDRALGQLAGHMRPADRLTLIGFAEQARVLTENATRDALPALLKLGAWPPANGSADLAAAIRLACEAARSVPSAEAPRVVFLTAGLAELDEAAVAKLSESLAELAEAKIPWQIVRLGAGHAKASWDELAQRVQGQVLEASSPAELHAVLWDTLTRQSSLVAAGATLKLTFNPAVVTSYRLLGHESATITGPATDPLEVDLHVGQAATGMYELWIKPSGGDEVARAELTWRDPNNGQPRRAAQMVRRAQIAASFSESPAWLQQGVIAAKTAEALRGSYYAPATRPLAQILELTRQVDARLAQQPTFQSLVELVKQAEKLR
jgi:Ca-activated chloride channel family protein